MGLPPYLSRVLIELATPREIDRIIKAARKIAATMNTDRPGKTLSRILVPVTSTARNMASLQPRCGFGFDSGYRSYLE